MHYIVLDMEWNMPENKYRCVRTPITLHNEIIQIGALKLDENLRETDRFDVLIRPVFYKKLNRFVKDLTNINPAALADGRPFAEAAEEFRRWCGDDSILITWGPTDIKVLISNLVIHGLPCDWIPESFDAQLMFDFQETMENRNFSLDYAVYYFKIKGNKGHDALNDARDTAEVIRHLDLPAFIAEEREYRLQLAAEEAETEKAAST